MSLHCLLLLHKPTSKRVARDVKRALRSTMLLRTIPAGRTALNIARTNVRHIHRTNVVRESPSTLYNILEGGPVPTTQVKTVSPQGVHLHDGRIIPSSCIFLDGKVFIWNVPQTLWEGWNKDHFQLFEMVVPKPGECFPIF